MKIRNQQTLNNGYTTTVGRVGNRSLKGLLTSEHDADIRGLNSAAWFCWITENVPRNRRTESDPLAV